VKDRAGVLAVLALALVWGYNWIVIKIATADVSPFVFVALRQVLGALALFAVVAITRRPLRSPHFGWTVLVGLLQIALMTTLQTLALATGGAGKTTILVYTFPFFMVLFAALFLGERLTTSRALAVGVAAAGLAFVLHPLGTGRALFSEGFAVAAAIAWALGSVAAKHFRTHAKVDLLTFTAWQMAYGAIALVPIALLVPGGYLHPTPAFFGALAYIVVLGTALAFCLWFFMIERFSASTAGISSLLTPVVSVFAAWIQLHEQPGATELIGMALIVVALLINTVPPGAWSLRRAA
jgi:drug/metabolite transporter (DMT)-like permease